MSGFLIQKRDILKMFDENGQNYQIKRQDNEHMTAHVKIKKKY